MLPIHLLALQNRGRMGRLSAMVQNVQEIEMKCQLTNPSILSFSTCDYKYFAVRPLDRYRTAHDPRDHASFCAHDAGVLR